METLNLFFIIFIAALPFAAIAGLVIFGKLEIKRKRNRKVTEIKRGNGLTRVTKDQNGNIIKVSNITYL